MGKKIETDICSVEDCENLRRKAGNGRSQFCSLHHARRHRSGEAKIKPLLVHRKDGHVTYKTTHDRLAFVRGKASEYRCACGVQASAWAYNHQDEDEQFSEEGFPYSESIHYYEPMCRSCHQILDRNWNKS